MTALTHAAAVEAMARAMVVAAGYGPDEDWPVYVGQARAALAALAKVAGDAPALSYWLDEMAGYVRDSREEGDANLVARLRLRAERMQQTAALLRVLAEAADAG